MMDIDEAIRHAEEMAKLNEVECFECAEEHRQLAEWLKELKELRKQKRPLGKWTEEFDESANPFFQRRWRCSACNDYNYYGRPDFCPCCGAPMTEEAFRKYNGLKEGGEK